MTYRVSTQIGVDNIEVERTDNGRRVTVWFGALAGSLFMLPEDAVKLRDKLSEVLDD